MIQINKMKNGIQVALDPMNSFQSISIGICIGVGSVCENERNNGISHLIEHMLFKGTQSRSARQLANEMARLGGEVNAYTTKEYTMFYVTTLSSYASDAIHLLADMLLHSRLDASDMEREKEVIYEEIDMYDDSAEDAVHERLHQAVWAPHPLSYLISGSKEQVASITQEDVIEYMKTWYHADNMAIAVSGAMDTEFIWTELQEAFGEVVTNRKTILSTTPVYHVSHYQKEMDIEQIHMNLCFPGATYTSDDRYPQYLLSGILGGNDNSRLFQRIREDLGLTYSIDAYDSFYQKAGLFQIEAVLNPRKQLEVKDQILNELSSICKHGVECEELAMAKEQIRIGVLLGSESNKDRVLQYARQLLFFHTIETEDVYLSKINRVTKDEIDAYARQIFRDEYMSQSLVGCINKYELDIL